MTDGTVQRQPRPRAASRTTKASREAIAMFVEQNLPRLDCWMQQVANGIPKVDLNCEPIRDNDGSIIYIVRPDPATAIKLVADICEYHLPRLSRSEATVVAQVENVRVEDMSTPALQRRLLVALGLDAIESGEAIEVEAIPAHQPDQSKP